MRRWRGLPYGRQQALSLLVLAVAPLIVVAIVMINEAGLLISNEADQRASAAARAVQSILRDEGSSLDRLGTAYAEWSTLQADAASLDGTDIALQVTDFQVDQGTSDAAAVVVGDLSVTAGSDASRVALERILRATLAKPGDPPAEGGFADLDDGVYRIVIRRIATPGLSGPGVAPAGRGEAGVALARRLGSTFVVSAKRLTDFDIAVYDRGGTLTAASDAALAADTGSPAAPAGSPSVDAPPPFRRANDVIGVTIPISDASGVGAGTIVVESRVQLLTQIGTGLIPWLAVMLALALVFAGGLAVYLASQLRRRLGTVEEGITAVAAGDLSVRLPAGDRDEIDRLAASHNRLAGTLERRDRIMWRSLDALESLRPERGPEQVGAAIVEAARSIFDLRSCTLLEADGSVLSEARSDPPATVTAAGLTPRRDHGRAPGNSNGNGSAPAGAPDEHETGAPLSVELETVPGVRLEARSNGAGWSIADQALFGLFARESGVALRSAGLHAEAARKTERLGQAHRLQREFVRGLGHNLQAPLARLLMTAEDLEPAVAGDAAASEHVRAIHADAERLARVVRQLLTATRLDAGVFVPEAEPFSLASSVRRTWKALGSDRRLELIDRSQGWLAVGDRDAIDQVLWVLLDNATRYAPQGTIHVTVGAAPPAELVVRVRDEGPGVPAGERSLIFRRFRRGSTSGGHEGTGLGLDVARRLVRSMGGQLRYEAPPEGGATFAFTLPAEPAQPE